MRLWRCSPWLGWGIAVGGAIGATVARRTSKRGMEQELRARQENVRWLQRRDDDGWRRELAEADPGDIRYMLDRDANRCPEVHESGARCYRPVGHGIALEPAPRRHTGINPTGHKREDWETPE